MKPKTTKELEAERSQRSFDTRKAKARLALVEMNCFVRKLSAWPKQQNLIKATHEHMNWLIAEDEAFAQAAAELFVEAHSGGGASEPDEYVGESFRG